MANTPSAVTAPRLKLAVGELVVTVMVDAVPEGAASALSLSKATGRTERGRRRTRSAVEEKPRIRISLDLVISLLNCNVLLHRGLKIVSIFFRILLLFE